MILQQLLEFLPRIVSIIFKQQRKYFVKIVFLLGYENTNKKV